MIIAIANAKGGTAKTTTVLNTAVALANKKKKVLVCDLDSQAHLTTALGVKPDELEITIYDLLQNKAELKNVLQRRGLIDLLPANIALGGIDLQLATVPGREFLLSDVLKPIAKKYDFVLLDTGPNTSLATINALTAADEVFIPVQCEFLSTTGVKNLLTVIETVKARLNKNLKMTGVIGTMYDRRKNLNRQVFDNLKKHFGRRVFNTAIRTNVALAESPGQYKDIFSYAASSHGAEDYKKLATEILKRTGSHEN